MRKIIYICLLLTVLVFLNGCSNDRAIIENNKNIVKVTINASPSATSKTVEDKNKIKEIKTYLNSLDLSTKVNTDKEIYMGTAYTITVYFDDKTSKVFCLDAHNIFHYENICYKIPYSQAENLKEIYSSLFSK